MMRPNKLISGADRMKVMVKGGILKVSMALASLLTL